MLPLIGLWGDFPEHERNRVYGMALRAVLDHNAAHAGESTQYFDPAKYFFSAKVRLPHHPTGRYNLRIDVDAVPIGEAVGGWGLASIAARRTGWTIFAACQNTARRTPTGPRAAPPPEPDPCRMGILESVCVSFFGSKEAKDKLWEIILAQSQALADDDDDAYAKGQADMAQLAKETAAAGVAADSFVGRMQRSGILPKKDGA